MNGKLITRQEIRRGDLVECPIRSTVGPHDATVTHVDAVGEARTVVSLSCAHAVNMSNGHGLYPGTPAAKCEEPRPAGFEDCGCDPADGHSSPCLFACRECGEDTAVEYGMCEACIHDAERSGWTPGSE